MDSFEKTELNTEEKVHKALLENDGLSFKLEEPVTFNLMTTSNSNVNEDSSSFVVIGKDSIDAQASILGSYVEIHQKSMSIDYKSMVSSMNIGELQQKLIEMLQDNAKLKETLKQSNLSMKEQFHTLAMWQEELMKVHQGHKEKFVQTKELVKQLKYENNELKNKLKLYQRTEDFTWVLAANSAFDITSVSNKVKLQQNTPQLSNATSEINEDPKDIKEQFKSYFVMPDKFTEKEQDNNLQQSAIEKDYDSAMKLLNYNDNITSLKSVNSLKCSEVCCAKDNKITCLIETIALLEQKLQCALIPTELHDLPEISSLNHQKFIQSMKQYNHILQELTNCFITQMTRSVTIEEILKEITDVVMLFDDDKSNIYTQQHREKLCHCCKQLADEQVNIITDRQILTKSQDQLQKILSDYNSILHELKITLDENTKLNVLKDNTARESSQRSEQLEQIKLNQQSLEEEKRTLDQEKDNLEEQKKLLEDQKNSLNIELISMNTEKKLLEQEKISLNEEKMSLDHQSQLYEDSEKALQNEKEVLQLHCDQLLDEMHKIQSKTQEMKTKHVKVLARLAQSMEENDLLRSQLTIYEEDFQAEKKLKEALLEEKSKLDIELHKQVEFNKQLQESATVYKQPVNTSEQMSEPNNGVVVCPKCDVRYRNLSALMEHIDTCLDP